MGIRQKLLDVLETTCADLCVRHVCIGLGYTAVQLDDHRTGVAYTLGRDSVAGCSVFVGKRPLAGRRALDLLHYLNSPVPIESAVGLATANALSVGMFSGGDSGDVLAAVDLQETDRVGMIGFFGPIIDQIEKRVSVLEICDERQSNSLEGVRPSSDAEDILAKSSVAFITSTTIINNSIDILVQAAMHCREVILLGPSTPLVPPAFVETPVTRLSGMITRDHEGLLRVIHEGGGTRYFSQYATKWNMPLNRDRNH